MEGSHLIVSFVILVVIDDHDLNPLKTPNGSSFYPCVFVSWNTSKEKLPLSNYLVIVRYDSYQKGPTLDYAKLLKPLTVFKTASWFTSILQR